MNQSIHDPRSTVNALSALRSPRSATTDPRYTIHVLCALLLALLLASPTNARAQAPDFIRGGDLSSLYRLERSGAVFTRDRQPGPAMKILRDVGMNLVRLRLWHTPPDGANGLEETLAMAEQVKYAGLSLLLDFHYSDSWADPGKQPTPLAWQGLTFEVLLDSVEQYTHDVMAALKAQGTLPEMVQLGNEITGGMLWPTGQLYASNDPQEREAAWHRFGELLKAARAGLERALDPDESIEVMIHIDRGGSLSDSRWFYDHLLAEGVEFDVIGLSYYPWWHGGLSSLETNLNTLAQVYGKDIVLAEVAYPFTTLYKDNFHNIVGSFDEDVFEEYPPSRVNQELILSEVRRIVESVPDGRGRGYIYWEPAWIAWDGSTGSPWENVALFNFGGDLNPAAISFFSASTTESEEHPTLPAAEIEHHVYPLPARETATLQLHLDAAMHVQIEVVDVLGRRTLRMPSRSMSPGFHEIELDVSSLPAGSYLYRIISDEQGLLGSGRLMVL